MRLLVEKGEMFPMSLDDNYSDGFFGGMIVSGLREQKVHNENRRVFEKVVKERDDGLKVISALRSEIEALKKKQSEMQLDYDQTWASNHIKSCIAIGLKLAAAEVKERAAAGDSCDFFCGSGIARSSAPDNELLYFEALVWKKAIGDLHWILEEMSPEYRLVFWEHVHRVFGDTFLRCTAPGAAEVPEELIELVNWKRPDIGAHPDSIRVNEAVQGRDNSN